MLHVYACSEMMAIYEMEDFGQSPHKPKRLALVNNGFVL